MIDLTDTEVDVLRDLALAKIEEPDCFDKATLKRLQKLGFVVWDKRWRLTNDGLNRLAQQIIINAFGNWGHQED